MGRNYLCNVLMIIATLRPTWSAASFDAAKLPLQPDL